MYLTSSVEHQMSTPFTVVVVVTVFPADTYRCYTCWKPALLLLLYTTECTVRFG